MKHLRVEVEIQDVPYNPDIEGHTKLDITSLIEARLESFGYNVARVAAYEQTNVSSGTAITGAQTTLSGIC